MKIHTNDFKNKIKQFGKEIDSKITFASGEQVVELGKEDLNSITPHYEGSILKSAMRQLDIDSNVEIPLETVINYQFGLKVGNEYEYLNYGNYVVYKVEKQEDTNSYKITCYDKILYSMIPYEAMNITYPITIRNYLEAICTKLGLTLKSGNFANEGKLIQNELYLDSEGNSLDYTFRDVLDEIAGATGSTICINEDTDELEVRYISNTGTQTTVEGTSISIENSDDEKIDLTLQGNTTQETTPTPNNPVAVNVVSGRQDIEVCKKNLCPTSIDYWESGEYAYADGAKKTSSSRIRVKQLIKVNPNTTYYFNTLASNTNYKFVLRAYNSTGTFVRSIGTINNGSAMTTSSNDYYIGITMYNSADSSIGFDTYSSLFASGDIKPFICLNSESDKSYEEYKEKSYEINLGKNLFDKSKITEGKRIDNQGQPYTDADYSLSDYIFVEPNTIYIRNLEPSVYQCVALYRSDKTFISRSTSYQYFTTSSDTYYIRFSMENDKVDTTQLEKGNQITPYSPYKTPIELCKIGDYQDFIKKGTGKNLFDKNNMIIRNGYLYNNNFSFKDANGDRSLIIECKPYTTYTISRTIKTGSFRVAYTNNNIPQQTATEQRVVCYGEIDNNSGESITITTNSNAKYLIVHYGKITVDSNVQDSLDTLQIEEGTTATPYEPYGMYNKWYIEKNIGKVVLDGTQDLYKVATGTSGYSRYNIDIGTNIYSTDVSTEKAPMYCNRLVGGTRGNTYSRIECIAPTTNSYSYKSFDFYIEALAQMTNAQVNNWLANNNMIVYYIYLIPSYTEITDSELIGQLNVPRLFEGLNNVSVSSADLGSPIKITYTSELDTIDEEYLKDINVNFGEKFGKVNSIVLSRSAESDNIYLRDEESVLENGLCEIKIKDNQIMNGNNRSDFLPGLLEALDGLEYYINDFASPGVLYYNLCDKYKVKVGNNYYKCIMFNDEVNVTQGLEENIYTEMPKESETDYTKSDKTDKKINQAYIIVDKQNQEINSVVQNIDNLTTMVNSQGDSITSLGTQLTQNVNTITASVSAIQSELDNGVSLVKTTSVLINNSGLNVSTDTSKITAIMSNNAFTITTKSSDNPLTFFGYDEVEQTSKAEMDNLTVKTYFVAGCHREEKYEENYENRTGWFYIGG